MTVTSFLEELFRTVTSCQPGCAVFNVVYYALQGQDVDTLRGHSGFYTGYCKGVSHFWVNFQDPAVATFNSDIYWHHTLRLLVLMKKSSL